ncbi:GNAT family N-acetyltransferase [Alteribacillus iranensis]|uniref:Predicted amidohydrolase n=1 Tax=Alteribacillus iranensis TaxID=930128 RepID=A0A1I2E3A2_9BACI|nr:GNAT family N-acetyltransferase [Alteribacillus iranensis]SFE86690.1 Predicted amidohydrolase [Alteribacillus iranensis]
MESLDVSSYENQITLRPMEEKDIDEVVRIARLGFDNPDIAFERKHYESHIRIFPAGQICVEFNGQIIGSSSSLIVNYEEYGDNHSIEEICGGGYITNHDPYGKHLYGIDVVVHPEYRHLKIGRRLYEERRKLCKRLNLKSIIFGGRIPNYHKYAKRLTAEEYVEQVRDQNIYDPVLIFQLMNGFEIRGVQANYLKEDDASLKYATILEWTNPDYIPNKDELYDNAKLVQVSTIQYPLTTIGSFDEFAKRCEYFINLCSKRRSDFAVLPDYITNELLSYVGETIPSKQARKLTEFTDDVLQLFSQLSVQYSINIITGSQFIKCKDELYSVSFLFHRNGKIDQQYKIHVPLEERKWFGVKPGNKLNVMDTDKGKIAILTGYDLLFPELTLQAVEQGAVLIFSPFAAKDEQEYWRMKYCAQSRAIESETFVVITGLSGYLSQVPRTDSYYSGAGIYSPIDISFPDKGVVIENNQHSLVVQHGEVDFQKIKRNRMAGSVTPLKDRRSNFYFSSSLVEQ